MQIIQLITLVALLASTANAWGNEGHEAVASIGYALLNPRAKATVDTLLKSYDFKSLEDAATWPDRVKKSTRKETGDYHFIDLHDDPINGKCGVVNWPTDCGDKGECAVTGIAKAAWILSSDLQKRSVAYGRKPVLDKCGNPIIRTSSSASTATETASSTAGAGYGTSSTAVVSTGTASATATATATGSASATATETASASSSSASTSTSTSTTSAAASSSSTSTTSTTTTSTTTSAAPKPTVDVVLPQINITVKGEALAFLTHFIGDVAQPLHASGYERGGNGVDVTLAGKKSNMHSAWDTGLVRKIITEDFGGSQAEWVAALLRAKVDTFKIAGLACASTTSGKDLETIQKCVLTWAQESDNLVCAEVFAHDFKKGGEVGDAYYLAVKNVINSQVIKGGHRLAAMLNKLLG
ncbi:hypothetical protein H9P43_000710 [Blastocladiella emersonii ATCC 22665]|nr:hypothetical protein H9P43_000710 [Blastocladiella emersonii ATCC 22665]